MGEGLREVFRIDVFSQLSGTDPVDAASQSGELLQHLFDLQRTGFGVELQHQHVTHHPTHPSACLLDGSSKTCSEIPWESNAQNRPCLPQSRQPPMAAAMSSESCMAPLSWW